MVARRGDPAELADLIAACGPGVSRCTSANSLPCAAWLVAGGNERERSTKGRWCRQSKCQGGGGENHVARRRFVLLLRLDEMFLSQTPSVSGHCTVSCTINYTTRLNPYHVANQCKDQYNHRPRIRTSFTWQMIVRCS